MKIRSDDGKAVIEFVRNDDADPYSGHWVRFSVSTIAGEFSGANGCVHFSEFRRFLSSFSEFVSTRHGEVSLDMTEDCRLQFFRWNQKGDVAVRTTISQWQASGVDPIRSASLKIEGTFKLDSEMLNSIERDFVEMQKGELGGTDNSGASPLRV